MSKKIKAIKFIIFWCIIYNIVLSISQTVASSINIRLSEIDLPNNIIAHKIPRKISSIKFEDFYGNSINLNDYYENLVLINFWATWCKPCKDEMPSLDVLSQNEKFKNLIILPINMEEINHEKTKKFFSDLKIKKLKIFFDPHLNFVKELKLRGVPTSILVDKKGNEFARITGSINFEDEKFLQWLLKYD